MNMILGGVAPVLPGSTMSNSVSSAMAGMPVNTVRKSDAPIDVIFVF